MKPLPCDEADLVGDTLTVTCSQPLLHLEKTEVSMEYSMTFHHPPATVQYLGWSLIMDSIWRPGGSETSVQTSSLFQVLRAVADLPDLYSLISESRPSVTLPNMSMNIDGWEPSSQAEKSAFGP